MVRTKISDVTIGSYLHDNTVETIASEYDSKRFNSPNDLIFDSNGDLWFTDPGYGLGLKRDGFRSETRA